MVVPAVVAETAVRSCTRTLSLQTVHTSPGRAATRTRCRMLGTQRERSRESHWRSAGCESPRSRLCWCHTSRSYPSPRRRKRWSTPAPKTSRRSRSRRNNPKRARQSTPRLGRGLGSRCTGANLRPSRCCTCSRPPQPTDTGREQAAPLAELGVAARVASAAASELREERTPSSRKTMRWL